MVKCGDGWGKSWERWGQLCFPTYFGKNLIAERDQGFLACERQKPPHGLCYVLQSGLGQRAKSKLKLEGVGVRAAGRGARESVDKQVPIELWRWELIRGEGSWCESGWHPGSVRPCRQPCWQVLCSWVLSVPRRGNMPCVYIGVNYLSILTLVPIWKLNNGLEFTGLL